MKNLNMLFLILFLGLPLGINAQEANKEEKASNKIVSYVKNEYKSIVDVFDEYYNKLDWNIRRLYLGKNETEKQNIDDGARESKSKATAENDLEKTDKKTNSRKI